MKPLRIIAIAAVLLSGCATPVDYSKPRPLKEGEVRVGKKKSRPPGIGGFDYREENIEVPRGVGRGRRPGV